LCVCTLEPRKNIIALLESFSLLPKTLQQQFPLVLLGGRGWRDDDIIWRIDNTAYVHYIGYVSDAEKTVLFRHASLFVFPSLYEGFGMPLLEAMTMKIPCIASNRPALTELGGDGVYFVDPHNIMMISQGIETLLSNQSLRDSITKKAYIQSKNFSWEKSAKEFLNLIV